MIQDHSLLHGAGALLSENVIEMSMKKSIKKTYPYALK